MSSKLNKKFIKKCTENLPISEPIYEFGSLQVDENVDIREYFGKEEFIGADIREGKGVDVILDLQNIDLPDESVGTVICLSTLEHVEFARKAIEEAYRILKPDGILIMNSVMNFPIHEYPSDYWRFTPEGFRSLLKPFQTSFVKALGSKEFPHTILGVGIKGIYNTYEFEKIRLGISTLSFKKFIPPILIPLLRKICCQKKN